MNLNLNFNMNLSGCDLSNANLEGADLSRANLQNINLEGASLEGANLSGANLKDAKKEAWPIERNKSYKSDSETIWPDGKIGNQTKLSPRTIHNLLFPPHL